MTNVQTACDTLGVTPGCSMDEVTKAFRSLSVKYHPDKNSGSEEKFKEISTAYEYLKQNGTSPPRNPFHNFSGNGGDFINSDFINEFFRNSGVNMGPEIYYNGTKVNVGNFNGPFGRSSRSFKKDINKGTVDISFSEAISGCVKDISVGRRIKCSNCNGTQVISVISTDPCERCNGTKIVTANDRELPCTKCGATGFAKKRSDCDKCNDGTIYENSTFTINIPPGVTSGNTIRIKGGADYINGVDYDAVIKISVEKDPEMERVEVDVISNITIPLLEALKGSSKEVRTAYGNKTLKIKSGIKNGDIIRVRGYGVGRNGAHIFKINVEYPDDTSKLIQCLEENMQKPEEIEGD